MSSYDPARIDAEVQRFIAEVDPICPDEGEIIPDVDLLWSAFRETFGDCEALEDDHSAPLYDFLSRIGLVFTRKQRGYARPAVWSLWNPYGIGVRCRFDFVRWIEQVRAYWGATYGWTGATTYPLDPRCPELFIAPSVPTLLKRLAVICDADGEEAKIKEQIETQESGGAPA